LFKRLPKLVFEVCHRISHLLLNVTDVTQFLINFFVANPDRLHEPIGRMKELINSDEWSSVRKCNDFTILIYLLLDWFEGFDTPIIDANILEIQNDEDLGHYLKRCDRFTELEIINTLTKTISQFFRRLTDESLATQLIILILSKMCQVEVDSINNPVAQALLRQMRKGATILH